MKHKRLVGVGLLIAVAIGIYSFKMANKTLVHKLKAPLLITGDGPSSHQYILPTGTSLYYDQAFPEGFVRYKLYVNVEGIKLDSEETTDQFWLDPLTAFPPDKAQLRKLLSDYPLTKQDLAEILKSSTISKTEIRELLKEYSD
jgi:hypothetical protein